MIKIAKDPWNPLIIEACHQYSLENDQIVRDIMGSQSGYLAIEGIMNDKLTNAIIREKVISLETGLEHNISMLSTTNGSTTYDAVRHSTKKSHEIKTEQHSTFTSRKGTQLTGGGAFGFDCMENVIKLRVNDPIISYAAFYDGRLLCAVEFLLSSTNIVKSLDSYISRQSTGSRTTCKFLKSDWKDSNDIAIKFLHPDWPKNANKNLRNFLKEKQDQLNIS
jgi:hypothetical protein